MTEGRRARNRAAKGTVRDRPIAALQNCVCRSFSLPPPFFRCGLRSFTLFSDLLVHAYLRHQQHHDGKNQHQEDNRFHFSPRKPDRGREPGRLAAMAPKGLSAHAGKELRNGTFNRIADKSRLVVT